MANYPMTLNDFWKSVGRPENINQSNPQKINTGGAMDPNLLVPTGGLTVDPKQLEQLGDVNPSSVQKTVNQSDVPKFTPYTAPINTAQSSDYNPYSAENIAQFQNYLPQSYKAGTFKYDPNTDPGLLVAQKQAMNQVTQDMVKRGRLYGSLTDTQQQQKAQELIPAFQQIAYQQFMGQEGLNRQSYLDEYNRMADILGLAEKKYNKAIELTGQLPGGGYTLQGLKDLAETQKAAAGVNTERAKTLGEFADIQKTDLQSAGEELKNKGIRLDNAGKMYDIEGKQIKNTAEFQEAERKQFEVVMPNVPMNAKNMASLNSFTNLNKIPEMAQLFSTLRRDSQNVDFAALINDAVATGDTELANALEFLRYEKVFANPELLLKYGQNFGMSDLKVAETAKNIALTQAKIIGEDLANQLTESKLFVQQSTEDAQILKILSEARQQLDEEQITKITLKYKEPRERQALMNSVQEYNNKIQAYNNAANAESRAQRAEGRAIAKFNVDMAKADKELEDANLNTTQKDVFKSIVADIDEKTQKGTLKMNSSAIQEGIGYLKQATSLSDEKIVSIFLDYGYDANFMQDELNKFGSQNVPSMQDLGVNIPQKQFYVPENFKPGVFKGKTESMQSTRR